MTESLNLVLDALEDSGKIDAEGNFDEADLLDAFANWAAEGGRPLYPHQEEALLELLAGNHAIIQTPTGSGKSMTALAAHFISLARGGRSYYSAPLKALVSEKFFDLVDVFGAHNVGLITGDSSVNTGAPVICCTAEILANQALREGALLDADTIVMDEFHFYADPQRGWAWQVPLLELRSPQFVLLSATLGDTSVIAKQITDKTGREVAVISDAERPVPLEFDYLVDPLPVVVQRLVDEGRSPIYVVHFTQAESVKSAVDLARTLNLPTDRERQIRDVLAGTELGRGFGKTLRELLLKGVGVHHAGVLPRYRRLVERLTQRGLLSIICGTDTLGVGINVPIRTVLFTSLVKFDGHRTRTLSAREFHQIAGRAGRAGFDSEGSVRVIATEEEVEAAKRKARMTAAQEAGDAAKKRKLAKRAKSARSTRAEGKVSWNRSTFNRLVAADPERLVPRFQTSHSMFLNVLSGSAQGGTAGGHEVEAAGTAAGGTAGTAVGGTPHSAVSNAGGNVADAEQRLMDLAQQAFESAQPASPSGRKKDSEESANPYLRQLGDIYRSLLQAGLIERVPAEKGADVGSASVLRATGDLPDDFALNQPLTPFALAALDLLDPESPTFVLDIVSVIESVIEDPKPVLYAQQRRARDAAYQAMREEGVDFEQRRDRIEEVTWPRPLEDLLLPTFDVFAITNPWVRGRELSPKSVLRDMLEEGFTFTQYVAHLDLTNVEGVLLRYLSDVYQALRQVLPDAFRTDPVEEVIDWLHALLRSVDVSLLSEWEDLAAGRSPSRDAALADQEATLTESGFGTGPDGKVLFSLNRHAMSKSIRNSVFRRVEMLAHDDVAALVAAEQRVAASSGWTDPQAWNDALDTYWQEHDGIGIDHRARSGDLFSLNQDPDATDLVLAAGVESADDLPTTTAGDYDWWIARQIILDPQDEGDWRLTLFVDRQETEEKNMPVMRTVAFNSTL